MKFAVAEQEFESALISLTVSLQV